MLSILKSSAYKNGYLIITAAWLYTLSFLFTNYFAFDSSPVKVAQSLGQYIAGKEKIFNDVCSDTSLLKDIINERPSDSHKELHDELMGIFGYAINDLGNPIQIYWNSNRMSVERNELDKQDGYYPVSHKNGYFELIKKTVTIDNRDYVIMGLIPVYWTYSIETEDVQNSFAIRDLEKKYTLSPSGKGIPVVNSNGNPVFFIDKKVSTSPDQPGDISVILRIIAIILLMIFVNSMAAELAERKGFFYGFFFLLLFVVAARSISYFFPFPFDYKRFSLFEPSVYASNSLHPSLGDLMINTILLFWVVSFLKFNYTRIELANIKLGERAKKIIGITALFLIPFFTMEIAGFISSLVKDSAQISFDVTNFFELNIYTLVSFIVICTLILSYFYSAQLLVKLSLLIQPGMYWRIIILLSFSLFLLSFKITGDADTLLNFALVAWLIIFYAFIELVKKDDNESFYSSAYFMPWSIFLMASVSALLIFQNRSLEHEKRRSIAETISLKSNFASATILDVTLNTFSKFISTTDFTQFYDEANNRHLKASLVNNNFQGYLNNFYTRIYTFDQNKMPLYNDDSASYNVINSIIINGRQTDNPELYYYETSSNSFSYIYKQNAYSHDSVPEGYVFLMIRPKAYAEEELSPQLFSQLIKDEPIVTIDYSYAIYNKYNLIKSSSTYNFSDTISKKEVPKFEIEYRYKNGYSELWYNAGDNKVIVVARKNDWFKQSVTFFAYLFGLFIILVFILHFGNLIFKTHFHWSELKKVFRFNIRTQIQAIIVAVSVISFIVIGVAIISYFIITFSNNNDKALRSTAQVIVNEIQQLAGNRFVAEDMMSLAKFDLKLEFEQKILDIGKTHNTDINFFDIGGTMLVSSQQYLYDNDILTTKMNPMAYKAMHFDRSTQYITDEEVVDYKFKSIYVPIKDEHGSTFAYLNIPFINSEKELKNEISNFLVTIIILNALIFIIAGTIAIWITRRITSSFTLIGNKMKAISFGSVNEEIEWKKDDELGELITEYNKMVRKLAESALALARSEREGAWREMARQVAHEIKNPLTPMKLSIQYLQRAIDNNAPNVKDLSTQVAGTLVEQIDQLSKIAGDFSQFANIANVNVEVFDLSNVISSIVQLFSADEQIDITWTKEEGTYMIQADKTQMHRLFTNLIKNAIEAYADVINVKVVIHQTHTEKEVIVSVQDKGHGIPVNMWPKIFAPNFTTKSSGTGLGLAICKGIVEKANGNIWFETKENVGTTFFVSLPLVHM